MATVLENLQTAKENLAAKIAEVTLDPKPSYAIDGQSVQWESYLAMLINQQEKLNELINLLDPYEIPTIST